MPECAGCCESNAIKGKTDETIDCSFFECRCHCCCSVGYNTVLDKRDKEDQIARLSAELETTQLQKENLQAAAAASNTADTAASEAAEAEGQYVDGTYDGEADGFGGTIAVEVTVEGGQITDLAITSADGEDSAYLSNAEAIIPKIIEAQSADVDTISGATFSSTGIRNAAQEAIEKAEK